MEKDIAKLKDLLLKREKELEKLDNEIKQFKGKIKQRKGKIQRAAICAMVDETKSVFINSNILTINLILIFRHWKIKKNRMKSNKKLYEKIINRIRAFEVCFSFVVQFFSQQERKKYF